MKTELKTEMRYISEDGKSWEAPEDCISHELLGDVCRYGDPMGTQAIHYVVSHPYYVMLKLANLLTPAQKTRMIEHLRQN